MDNLLLIIGGGLAVYYLNKNEAVSPKSAYWILVNDYVYSERDIAQFEDNEIMLLYNYEKNYNVEHWQQTGEKAPYKMWQALQALSKKYNVKFYPTYSPFGNEYGITK